MPSIIWFYYFYGKDDCGSPLDDIFSTLCFYYYFIIGLFIIFNILKLIKCENYENLINGLILPIIHLIIYILSFILLVKGQKKYNKNWDNNICVNLKPLTILWLILNYFHIILWSLVYIIYIFVMLIPIITVCSFGEDD